MPNVSVAQDRQHITFRTDEVELVFSLDDGGLRVLRRVGGPNVVGYGPPQPAIDVQVGIDGAWLAERVFVRYLRHHVRQSGNALDIEIVIGIGPLMIADCYHVTGTLIARSATIHNVSEDEIWLRGLRLIVPWVRIGEVETCRFEAPGNSVRPRLPLSVAAAQRRSVVPRRFFSPGFHMNRTIEFAPMGGPGLLAIYDMQSLETLMCWFDSQRQLADPQIEGNGGAVTFVHEITVPERLGADAQVELGTQYLLLLRESWQSALASYRRTVALFGGAPQVRQPAWLREAACYEVYAGQCGGFLGLRARLGEIRAMGITTLVLLPIWAFARPDDGGAWDENWQNGGNPYIIRDFARIDTALGSAEDLRALTDAAHRLGMRVVLDLPLIGCSPDSPYVRDHPDWFWREEEAASLQLLEGGEGYRLDWANPELQAYWFEQSLAQAEAYQVDGFRAIVTYIPRSGEAWVAPQLSDASAGSMALVQFIGRLHAALQARSPEAALLTTMGGPSGEATTDMVVDDLVHHQFMHAALNRVPPEELGRWLEDAALIQPLGVARAAFVESYRTWLLNPLADGLRGSLLSRIALAGLVFCGFVPIIRCGQEDCDRDFIQMLLTARARHPLLCHGGTAYNAVPCDDPQVFAVLRSYGGAHMLGLLKIGARKRTATFSLPVDLLGLEEGIYTLYDVLRGQPLSEHGQQQWQRDELLSFQLTLEPFEAYGLLLERVVQPVHTVPLAPAPRTLARPRANGRKVLAARVDPDGDRDIEEGP